jgi:hypothetical protein
MRSARIPGQRAPAGVTLRHDSERIEVGSDRGGLHLWLRSLWDRCRRVGNVNVEIDGHGPLQGGHVEAVRHYQFECGGVRRVVADRPPSVSERIESDLRGKRRQHVRASSRRQADPVGGAFRSRGTQRGVWAGDLLLLVLLLLLLIQRANHHHRPTTTADDNTTLASDGGRGCSLHASVGRGDLLRVRAAMRRRRARSHWHRRRSGDDHLRGQRRLAMGVELT